MPRGDSGKRTHRRDRVVRRFLLVVAALAVLALLAPTIIGHTPIRNTLLARALPPEAGTLSAGGASLGWFSSMALRDVQLTGPDGRLILRADRVGVDRSLAALATGADDLGAILVERPVVYAVVRPDGSNLEDFAAALAAGDEADPEPQPEESAPLPRFHLTLAGGSIAVTDAATGQTLIHDPIDLELVSNGAIASASLSGSAHAAMINAGGTLPQLPMTGPGNRRGGAFNFQFAPNTDGSTGVKFSVAGLGLDAAAPWLRRIDPSMRVAGVADGQGAASLWLDAAPGALPQRVTSNGQLRVQGFQLNAAALGGDTISTRQFDAPWRITTTARGDVELEQLGVATDFATANVTGRLTAAELNDLLAGVVTAPRNARLTADVDLAELARVAPAALHLHEDVRLTSGRVQLNAAVRSEAEGRAINASLETADLAGQRGGRPIVWSEPFKLRLDARELPTGLVVDRLVCESSFLTGSASGDLANLSGEARLDLDRFVTETRQLFDLGPWRLAGRADARVQLARGDANRFRATAAANINGCVVSYGDRPVVLERELTMNLGAEGAADPSTLQPTSLTAASVGVVAGGDRLDARLTAPTAFDATAYPLDVRLTGDLAAWVRRLKSVLPSDALTELTAAGAIDLQAAGRFGGERIEVASATGVATDLQLETPSLRVNEPKVDVSGDFVWDAASGRLASQGGQLVSSTVALRARRLTLDERGATGELAVRANLARIGAVVPDALGNRQLSGELSGGVQLAGGQAGPAATIDLTANGFAIAEPNAAGQLQVLWQEPTLGVRGNLTHESAADRLTLTNLAVRSQNLSGTINGRVDRLSTAPAPTINGSVDYDLAQLTPLVQSWLGPGVQLTGQHQAQFEIAATGATGNPPPHWSRAWTGRFSAPWTAASLYGLAIGQGAVSGNLGNGALQLDPLQFAVGQGRLATQPAVRFDPAPAEWGLPAGELATAVAISPEVSDEILKFVAPVLANATRSEGVFSIRTDGVRAPLGNIAAIETTGQLALNAVQIRPGPGVAEWVSIARQVEALARDRDPTALANRPLPTLLSISERTVNFQIAQGRVAHQGLQFEVDGVPVESSGVVGFDESLELQISIPIQDRWIANAPRLVGLRGQVLRVPVRGTLRRPQVDRRALQDFNRQLIRDGIRGAVEGELGRALEKLFN